MAYRIRVTVDYDWVPDGSGMATLGVAQSNDPGYGATATAGAVGAAQTLRDEVAESVPGGDSPTSANFTTALNNAATDLASRLSTAGAAMNSAATPLSIIQGWSTGNP